jgi:putative ABC transport system permease protein
MAVGARQKDVLRQFLFEATGLSVIGGAVGVAIGIGAAYAISNAAGWPLLIEPESVILAVAFSGLVGLFFGWYPAMRASRLDPIQALRHT